MSAETCPKSSAFPNKSSDATSPDPAISRFSEPTKFLPVAFVLCIIASLWIVYVSCHCVPLLTEYRHDSPEYSHGWLCLVVVNVLTLLLLTCYFRCMLQHPGTIPDNATSEEGGVSWDYAPVDAKYPLKSKSELHKDVQEQKETKRLGDPRTCKWCNKYKPDRCHHCRVCRMCILKMDHHCPWVYNCVGFKNLKYFFLLILYAALACNWITWTMLSTVNKITNHPATTFMWMFALLLGESLAGLMAFLTTAFFAFHVHLMLRARTTIEFCEKSRRPNFDTEGYSRGLLGNVKAVLGDDILLWFFPISPPSGTGVNFRREKAEKSKSQQNAAKQPIKTARAPEYGATSGSKKQSAGTGEQPDFEANAPPTFSGS